MRSPERQDSAAPAERLERGIQAWGLILWHSFLAACVLVVLFFSMVDAAGLNWPGQVGALSVPPSARAIYTVAFFAIWMVCMGCSRVVLWMAASQPPRAPTALSGRPGDGPGAGAPRR
jgi:uncharacterized membrane protein HdeD (DUF308 family)